MILINVNSTYNEEDSTASDVLFIDWKFFFFYPTRENTKSLSMRELLQFNIECLATEL